MPPAKGFRFEPNEAGIFDAANGDGVKGILNQRATDAQREIRKLSPSRRAFFDYRKNVKVAKARRVGRTYEAAVFVDSAGWHLVEYGTAYRAPTAPIRRGMKLARLDFRENE